jgi:hypothetical protein
VLEASPVSESIGSHQCVTTRVSVLHDDGGARRGEKLVTPGLRPMPQSAAICRDLQRADLQDRAMVDAGAEVHDKRAICRIENSHRDVSIERSTVGSDTRRDSPTNQSVLNGHTSFDRLARFSRYSSSESGSTRLGIRSAPCRAETKEHSRTVRQP